MTVSNTKASPTKQVLSLVALQSNNTFGPEEPKILANADSIDQVYNLMCDETSSHNYIQQIAYLSVREVDQHCAELFNPLPQKQWVKILESINTNANLTQNWPDIKYFNPDDAHAIQLNLITNFVLKQYQYKDLVTIQTGDIFLDCGAFFGETNIWAYQNGAEKVYSFEPNALLAENLKQNLTTNNCPYVNIAPYAVSNTNSQNTLFVNSSFGYSCGSIMDDSAVKTCWNEHQKQFEVNCIRLDDWCNDNQVIPTFIKMDIEGAELLALEGASQIIVQHKPKLAICLYHKTEHMWKIPLYLHSLVPEYKFYCKKSHPIWEFVLFATCN